MTITVLMSVYDNELPDRLDRSLRSVWSDQILRPDEVLLVLDGPIRPELMAIVRRWQEIIGSSFTLIRNKRNLGLTKSLNRGLDRIKNDLIARMDSDDISLPHRFRAQHDFLEAHPDIDVVGGSIQEFDAEDHLRPVRHYPTDPNEIASFLCKGSPLAHPSVMMRRRIFDSGLRYDDSYPTSQDVALWFEATKRGIKISNLEETTLLYRSDDGTISRRSRKKALNEFKIYMEGIRELHGVRTWRYVYPMGRLMLRMLPKSMIKKIYYSTLRTKVLRHKDK